MARYTRKLAAIVHKQPDSVKNKAREDFIPDARNKDTCLNCPYADCIGRKCTLIKGFKE